MTPTRTPARCPLQPGPTGHANCIARKGRATLNTMRIATMVGLMALVATACGSSGFDERDWRNALEELRPPGTIVVADTVEGPHLLTSVVCYELLRPGKSAARARF